MAEKTNNKLAVAITSDLEVTMTRTFDAPRSLIFKAFSTPEHISRWWGRREDVTRVEEFDFRPGGAWRFVSRGADGIDYPFKGVFHEIVEPELIVQSFIYDVEPFSQHESIDTVRITEQDGKTTLISTSRFDSREVLAGFVASGMEEGAGESYDRLAELLATLL
jgi:uncharacterized protein YndB with AHSA1/START domain